MKVHKIALTISFLSFAIGFSDLRENMFFYLGRPIGAIAFIVFFISMLLEKEYALFDQQERAKAISLKSEKQSASKGSNTETCAPALTTALSH